MKKIIKKHKWLIGLFLSILILLGGVIYLYHTKGLNYLFELRWLIGLFLSMLILLGVITYFYYTNRLDGFFNLKRDMFWSSLTKFEKWILSGSLISAITLNIFLGLFSSFLYGLISPNPDNEILTFGSDPIISLLLLKLRSLICKIPGLEAPFWV